MLNVQWLFFYIIFYHAHPIVVNVRLKLIIKAHEFVVFIFSTQMNYISMLHIQYK